MEITITVEDTEDETVRIRIEGVPPDATPDNPSMALRAAGLVLKEIQGMGEEE